MSQAQEALLAVPSAVTALSGAEASGAASHSSEGNGPHSFGGQISPRAARSQISTAVSFEGARAAGSAALPSRSLEEESALSAAEGDVECSHSADPNQASRGGFRPARGVRLPRPSNSLISTAVQPASPRGHAHQPASPKLTRANSVVSHTAPGARTHGARAGTPASVYGQGQGFLLPSRARQQSPAQAMPAEQVDQQTAAAGTSVQHQPNLLQLPPAWQNVPPAIPALQDMCGPGAGQQPVMPHQHPHLYSAMHRMDHGNAYNGHNRNSSNGGSQLLVNVHPAAAGTVSALGRPQQQQHGSIAEETTPAEDVAGGALAGGAASFARMAAAAGTSRPAVIGQPHVMQQQQPQPPQQQHGAGLLQSNLQLFQSVLTDLPAAATGGLLHSLLGLNNSGADRNGAQGHGMAYHPHAGAAAVADGSAPQAALGGASHGSAAAAAAGSSSHRQQSMVPTAGVAADLSADLMQQLPAQVTPALLAVLQGQEASGAQGDSQQAHSLQQQLQQALSLLLAGLASQAEQYRLAFPGVLHPGPAGQQSQQQPYAGTSAGAPTDLGMLPPPAPPSQAKSCDSSIPGPPCVHMLGSTAGQPHGTTSHPNTGYTRCLPPEAAAAMQAGVQQADPSHMPHAAAGLQPMQQHNLGVWEHQQQQAQRGGQRHGGLQHTHWRSPSPSPVPVGHAAARTSTAGEGHGSLHLGNQGMSYPQPQQAADAAAAAISSGGGVSRAGGGLISEEGEAEAVAMDADPEGAAVGGDDMDDAGQQASIGEAAPAFSLEHHQQQEAFRQQQCSSKHQALGDRADHLEQQCTLGIVDDARAVQPVPGQYHTQQPLRDQQLCPLPGDAVQQAASVHATMVSEGNESEGDSGADSEQSSTHSGNSNSHMGGAEGGHGNLEAEIVSQPCGASHSASLPPSESMPAAATATGPMSRSTAGEYELGTAGINAAAAAGNGAVIGGSARPVVPNRNMPPDDFMLPPQQPAFSGHRSNQQASKHKQQDSQHYQHHRDSSLAMATAGPTGTHSATISTNSGTVDMSIRNDSQRSGAGSQGAAAVVENGGWVEDDADVEMQGATNSRDGEARGEPPGACDTAESGRAVDAGYQPLHQHHLHHGHQQNHVPTASPMPGYSAAAVSPVFMGEALAQADSRMLGSAHAAAAAGRSPRYTGQAVQDPLVDQQHQQHASQLQQHSVRFATASAPGDVYGYMHIGSPSLQGGYSSSNVGIPGVSTTGHADAVPRRESSAGGNAPAGAQGAVDAFGIGQSVSANGVDAGSTMIEADAGTAQASHRQMPEATVADYEPPHPAVAQHIEQVALGPTFSVTSQLQPMGQHQHLAGVAAGVGAGQTQRRQASPHQHHQQQHSHQNGGNYPGTNAGMAPVVSVMTTASQVQAGHYGGGHPVPVADAVPQVTEIHGYFAGHAVPATAAAAQMAAAAASAAAVQHAHVLSDVQPQVTEMHGMLGASAGTAAEAQLAAAAAVHGRAHAFDGTAAATASGAAGATGSTMGDGRLPPLPHVHSSRGYPVAQHRTSAAAAAGTSRVGAFAGGSPGIAVSPLMVAGNHGASRMGSTHNMQAPRSASAEAPQAAAHGRASYSPPAVNFDPVEQATAAEPAVVGQLAEGNGHAMPKADAGLPVHQKQEHYDCSTLHTRAADAGPAAGAPADYDIALPFASGAVSQRHREQQPQQYPASPGDAQIQGNSQLGQQDGSRGSPPLGMGRVGSVPPQDPGRVDGGGEAGVVEQQSPLCARHTLDEDAGSHHQVVGDGQQLQHIEQEADGPLHAPQRQLQQHAAESKSGATSPSQQQRCRHPHGYAAAADRVASAQGHRAMSQQRSEQAQQHWQQLQGAVHEGAGQVGGRAASMRFSYGQAEGSAAAGISSKIYGSVSAGFASGSKAEGSPSYGAGLDGCSYGDAMASGANGNHHAGQAQQHTAGREDDSELNPPEQATGPSSHRRPQSGGTSAAAISVGMLQEGEGSHGSKSQEARSCKRQRTSCEAASVPQHMTSSMQTTEA